MTDLHLCAPSAAALAKALPWLRGADGEWITVGDGFTFDPIGAIAVEGAVYDETMDLVRPAAMAKGWHGNLRCTEEVAARVPVKLLVAPETPRRVWL